MASKLDFEQVIPSVHDEVNAALQVRSVAGALVSEKYDHVTLTYVAAGNGAGEIETVTFREGGPAGTVVATLTLAYDASNRLSSVARS